MSVVLVYAYEGDATQASSVACWIDGVADYVNLYEYDTQGNLIQIVQTGQSGGNAVAEKEIDLSYNEDGQLTTMTRYLEGELVVVADYTYDSYGRLVSLVYSQGPTVLASYAWTYTDSADSLLSPSPSLPLSPSSSWLPNGGLPVIGSVGSGQGMLPVYDTTGIAAALAEGAYYATSSLLTSCTSFDGTATYTYDATGQLSPALAEKIARMHLVELEHRGMLTRRTVPSADVVYQLNEQSFRTGARGR